MHTCIKHRTVLTKLRFFPFLNLEICFDTTGSKEKRIVSMMYGNE